MGITVANEKLEFFTKASFSYKMLSFVKSMWTSKTFTGVLWTVGKAIASYYLIMFTVVLFAAETLIKASIRYPKVVILTILSASVLFVFYTIVFALARLV